MDDSNAVPVNTAGRDDADKPDRRKNIRERINLILPDSLMIVLAVIIAPVVLVPALVHLSASARSYFDFADYTILGVFIIEYLLKTIFAENVWRHIVNPWHLLDLVIIVVPLVSFFPAASNRFGTSSLLLRLLRIVRLVAIGGRTVDRKAELATPAGESDMPEDTEMQIRVMDGQLENNYENVSLNEIKGYLESPTHTWVDVSYISEGDIEVFSRILGIPRILLESEMVDESYPRVDYFEHYAMIFARIADIQVLHHGPARLFVNRKGILVICQKQNVITLSRGKTDLFNRIIEKAKKIHTPEEPIVVTVLYAILKYLLEQDRQIIAVLERELMVMESTPLKNRPAGFLETTFHLRKEVDQLVPSLLHLKEIVAVITSKRVPLEGFSARHEKIFDILMDEAIYLHETASNARDNLQSLMDLYINTTSFETNRVMRVIAVITSLGIIPALFGLLGSNIVGNPWNLHLWQVFAIVGVVMVAMGWIFYRLGWLKG
ncbi:MAG: CorA family divalent cation transporter [Dehalococcoidales bacterium]|jgi:Mg2+ and Co2+ transporter CorA